MNEKNPNPHKGHRQKVKNRFIESGMESMPDHNILEMLLFFAIPYKDTNEIAHSLIEKFGSFSGVLKASYADLKSIKGMSDNAACLITMLLPMYRRYLDDINSEKSELKTTQEIVEYIRPKFIDTVNERVFLICFDAKQKLICSRQVCEGDLSGANFEMKKLAGIVIETNASSAVLVHNHPSSIAKPSPEDIVATKAVFDLLESLKVTLSDHIIIAENGEYCSMIKSPRFAHAFYGLDNAILD